MQHAQNRPLAIDLFSGAGGLSLGVEQAGFDVVAAVEYDPVHAATHHFNFSRCQTLCADASKLEPEQLIDAARQGARNYGAQWNGEIDAVFGGPPCQGFSLIGRRLIDDPRNTLVYHFKRLVLALRPKVFVMENVPGMKTGGHASILRRLIDEFSEAGYRFRSEPLAPFEVLNAADFGVPQERRRLILIGVREDLERPPSFPSCTTWPVAKRPGMPRKGDPTLPNGPTVRDAIGDIPNLDDFETLLGSDEVRLPDEIHERAASMRSRYAEALHGRPAAGDLAWPRTWDPTLLTSSARTAHTDLSVSRFAATPPGETEAVSRFYRLHPDGLCNTLRAGSGSERGAFTSPRPIHPLLPRVISVREAARLHGFPDWFRLHTTKWHGFRQIGNAVVPPVGRAIAAEVARVLGATPKRPEMPIPLGDTNLLRLKMVEATEHFGAAADQIPAQRMRGAKVAA